MNYTQPALENRPTVDDPAGGVRNADIVLGAAVIAMGLLAGLYYFSSIAVMPALTAADDRIFRPVAPASPTPQAGSSPASPSTR